MYGDGAIMRLGDEPVAPIEVIPSGSLALDKALGVGGIPRGRIVEVYGPEAGGKTTVALHIVANAQRQGGTCAFIDAEHALDLRYAENLGVDTKDLLVSQPDNGEQGLEITDLLVQSGEVSVVVVDSVAALVPRAEIEGDMGDAHVGLLPRLMGQALRKMVGVAAQTKTTILFINQLRMNIGAFGNASPYVTPGGKAMKFSASVRLDVKRIETLRNTTEAYGQRNRVTVAKNKLAPPFKTAEFDIIWGEGISHELELIDLGQICGVVKKAGTWFSVPINGESVSLGQGRENARLRLKQDPDLSAIIRQAIEENYVQPSR
jgi:recombination protein RecA